MSKNKNSKDSEEIDIQKAFEEEIQKPYYKVDYLDNFKLPYDKLDVSAVIPTYNRCPYKPNSLKGELNPLSWAIKSLLLQKPPINEIIIVDDKSDDYTKQVIDYFKEKLENKKIKLSYIKNQKRIGPDLSRNIGVGKSTTKYIHFVDDDCFITPYSCFGAVYTFEEIEKKGIRIGAVNLPTYTRSSLPKSYTKKKNIGSISFIEGSSKANKDLFPEEYLSQNASEKFLNPELGILNPFPIFNTNTTSFLCSKKAFMDIGGFPKEIIKRMGDREFGCRITENGYDIYFQPDLKFHCVHGIYGLQIGKPFIGEDWFKKIDKSISLKKAMAFCDKTLNNSGTRMNAEEYIYESIQAFFCLTYLRNKRGAIKWIKKVYDEFVKEGETDLFGNENIPVPSEDERKRMWINSIYEGLRFIKEKEKQDVKKINFVIKKLQEKTENTEDIFKIMGGL